MVSVNGAERRAQVNALWAHGEHREKWENRTFQGLLIKTESVSLSLTKYFYNEKTSWVCGWQHFVGIV